MQRINADDLRAEIDGAGGKKIKAIETRYNGYHFRSRLEARWAVFFDVLHLRYEYEKEGFDLGDAGLYLPDFWLPEMGCWIEIKPGDIGPDELKKTMAFSSRLWEDANSRLHEVHLIAGDPYASREGQITNWNYTGLRMVGGVYNDAYKEYWIECPLCHTIDLRSAPWPHSWGSSPVEWGLQCMYCDVVDRDWKETEQTKFHKGTVLTTLPMHDMTLSARLEIAYIQARSARFEHGEKG